MLKEEDRAIVEMLFSRMVREFVDKIDSRDTEAAACDALDTACKLALVILADTMEERL